MSKDRFIELYFKDHLKEEDKSMREEIEKVEDGLIYFPGLIPDGKN